MPLLNDTVSGLSNEDAKLQLTAAIHALAIIASSSSATIPPEPSGYSKEGHERAALMAHAHVLKFLRHEVPVYEGIE